MDNATAVNIALTLFGVIATTVNAWVLMQVKNTREDIKSLQTADIALVQDLAAVKVLVAGKYITREEFNLALDRQTTQILQAIRAQNKE